MVRFLIIVLPLFSVDFWNELVFFFDKRGELVISLK